MATSYTTLLGLALPVQGELQGTWGDEVNNYITNYLDAAVAGTQTLSTDADVTLTKTTGTSLGATSSQYSILRFSGARTAQRTVTVPAASKTYVAINDTTGGFAVKVVGAGPTTGITIAAGEAAVITWNGSDFVKISSNQVTLAGNNAFTGANTFYNSTGQTFGTATSTQDGLILTGRAGGSSSYRTSITPGTLTASNTLTLPIQTTTLAGLGTTQTFTGINTFTPTARTSGVASYFTLTTPADTGQTASTESIGANFTAATRTWATGALTLQRERVFAAPTYAFAGASTLTTAVNVDIAAPVAGTNATITSAYALRAAASQFTGAVNITGLTASKPIFTDASKNLTSTGTVPVDQGGTGQTTYTNGQLLIGNTTGNTLTKATLTAGSGVSITNGTGSITISATGSGGDVVGPASSTDNAVVRFDGATGKLVQNSAVTIADTTGDITGGAYNKVTITAPATSATLTIANNKTLTANNSLTLAGTDATTMTFPTTSASIARTDAGQTFTGTQTVLAAATQDAVALAGRAGGTSSYTATITPTTLTASRTLTLPDSTTTVVGTDATQTLTNKRNNPRVTSTTSASSLTPDISAADMYAYTALAANLTINAPTGTPVDGNRMMFRFLDNGTPRTLTWNATYTVIGVTLPTTTVANKTTYIGCMYNAAGARWDVIAVTTQL